MRATPLHTTLSHSSRQEPPCLVDLYFDSILAAWSQESNMSGPDSTSGVPPGAAKTSSFGFPATTCEPLTYLPPSPTKERDLRHEHTAPSSELFEDRSTLHNSYVGNLKAEVVVDPSWAVPPTPCLHGIAELPTPWAALPTLGRLRRPHEGGGGRRRRAF